MQITVVLGGIPATDMAALTQTQIETITSIAVSLVPANTLAVNEACCCCLYM